MIRLVLVILAGILLLDVAVEAFRILADYDRRAREERDRWVIRRSLERTDGVDFGPRRYGKTS